MHDLRTLKIPKITDGYKFEHLCRDIWRNNDENELVNFNGRPGQHQNGVDIFGRNIGSGGWFGIQCKARTETNKLSKSDILGELEKGLTFNPTLNKYLLCTTLERDANLQEIEREINDQLINKEINIFRILFWNDIEEILKEEVNFNIYYKYYQNYFADNTTLGHAIGKLINLELGVGTSIDTHYELIIGKIPRHKKCDQYNVNYYRGSYFVVNLTERKMATFTLRCFASDLAMAFSSEFDMLRIAKWINSVEELDKLIYEDTDTFEAYLPIEEQKEFIETFEDSDT